MEVRNEIEIFIRLAKYNPRQRHKKGKSLVVNYLVCTLTPPHNSVQYIFEE